MGCEKRGCSGQKKVEGHSIRRPLWGGKRLMAKKKKKIRLVLLLVKCVTHSLELVSKLILFIM